jgi:hypothetical protein
MTPDAARVTPRWWQDPVWQAIPWTCPRCGRTAPGTPAIGEPCACGFREEGD